MENLSDLPNFQSSEFGGSKPDFLFDFARLQSSAQLPRPFLHRHGYYHILWMTRACGEHIIDFETYELKDNAVFFLSPGQVHTWTSSIEPQGYIINISTQFFLRILSSLESGIDLPFSRLIDQAPVLYLTHENAGCLEPLLLNIEDEFKANLPGQQEVVKAFLLVLLTRLWRLYPPKRFEPSKVKDHETVKRFKRLVEQNFSHTTSVKRYAQDLALTERKLSQCVKSVTGHSPVKLIHQRLALEAKRLLTQTELGISELAYQLNFEDPAYFSRFFRRETGFTPTAFRATFLTQVPG